MKVTLNPIAIEGLRNRIINRHETRKALTDILNSTPGLLNNLLEILNRETNRETNQKHKPTLSDNAKQQIIAKIKNRHQPITDKKTKGKSERLKGLQNIKYPDFFGMRPRSLGIADFVSNIPKKLYFYGTSLYDFFVTREANTLLNTLNPQEKPPILNFMNKQKKDESNQLTRSDSNDNDSVNSYDQDEVYESESESETEKDGNLSEPEKEEKRSTMLNSLGLNVPPINMLKVDPVQLYSRSSSSSFQPIFPSLNQPARNTIIDRIRNRHPYLVPSLNQPAIDAIIKRIRNRHPYLVQILQNTEGQANLLLGSLDKPAKTYKLENITPILQSAEKDANDLLSALFKGTTIGTTGPITGTTSKTDNLNNLGELIINGEVFVMSPDGKSMIQKAIP